MDDTENKGIAYLIRCQKTSQIIWWCVIVYQIVVGIGSLCSGFYGIFMICLGIYNLIRSLINLKRYPKIAADPDRLVHFWARKLVGLIWGLIFNIVMGGLVGGIAVVYDINTCAYARAYLKHLQAVENESEAAQPDRSTEESEPNA